MCGKCCVEIDVLIMATGTVAAAGTDRERKGWTLWAVADEFDGRRMYAQLAHATPFHGHTAKLAAKQLLIATWRAERLEMWEEDLRGACVDEEGLLTKFDVERIECEVFGPELDQ